MLGSIARLMSGGSDLLGAEFRLGVARLAEVGVACAVLGLVALLAGAGLLALAGGAAGALAPQLGWPGALAVVGGSVVAVAALTGAIVVARLRRALRPLDRSAADPKRTPAPKPATAPADESPDLETARRDVLAAKRRLHRALNRRRTGPTASDSPLLDWSARAVHAAIRNPEAVAAGAFALASVIGPTRTFRLASRAAGAAGMVATALRFVRRELAEYSNPRSQPSSASNGAANIRT